MPRGAEVDFPEGGGLADRSRNYGASHECSLFSVNVYTKFQEGLLTTIENSKHEVGRAAVLRNLDVTGTYNCADQTTA